MARILVVDDQEMMRDSLGRDAVARGPRGRRRRRRRGGVRAAQRPGRFDLLITDLKMPRMTGIELLPEAKRSGRKCRWC